MKRLILFLLLASPCFGQAPRIIQSAQVYGAACVFANNVTSGHVIIVSSGWLGTNNTPSVSDTLSSTWTQRFFDTSLTQKFGIYTTTLGSSGADTVTFTVTGSNTQNTSCEEYDFGGFSTTVDVSTVASFTTTTTPTGGTLATNNNGDFIYSALYSVSYGIWVDSDTLFTSVQNNPTFVTGGRVLGVAGNYHSNYKAGGSFSGAIASVAFAPTTMAIINASLPDSATSNSYSYQLISIGGNGALTWSVSSGALPLGLTLSSGGLISGTPTNSAAGSFTIRVTDGTNSATKSFSLNVGTSLNTIAYLQTSNASGVFSSNVASGSLLVVIVNWGGDRTAGILKCTDTRGTPLVYAFTVPTSASGSYLTGGQVHTGITPSGGADTVTCTAAPGSTTFASEFSNSQNFTDFYAFTSGTSGTSLTTASLTTPTTNSLVHAFWGMINNITGTITAPCNQIYNHVVSADFSCYEITTSVTGYTENMTTNSSAGNWAASIMAFRPTISGTAPLPPSNAGQSQVY